MSFDLRAVISADATGFHTVMRGVQQAGHQLTEELAGKFGTLVGFTALEEGFRSALEYGHKIKDLNLRTGIPTEDLQKFDYAATKAGIGLDQLVTGVEKLGISQAKARAGNTEMFESLLRLGLSAEQIHNLDAVPQNFITIADRIKDAEVNGQMLHDVTEAMGRSARELLPAFKEGLGEAGEEAKRLGLIIEDSGINHLAEAEERLKAAGLTIRSFFAGIFNFIYDGLHETAIQMRATAEGILAANNAIIHLQNPLKAYSKAYDETYRSFHEQDAEEKEKKNKKGLSAEARYADAISKEEADAKKKAEKEAKDEAHHLAREETSEANKLTALAKETAEIQRKTSLEGLTDAEKRRKLTQEIHTLETMIGVQRGENDALGAAETLKEKAQREQDLKKLNTHLEPASAWMTDSLAKIGGFTGGADNRLMALQERIALASEKTADNTRPLPGGGDELYG